MCGNCGGISHLPPSSSRSQSSPQAGSSCFVISNQSASIVGMNHGSPTEKLLSAIPIPAIALTWPPNAEKAVVTYSNPAFSKHFDSPDSVEAFILAYERDETIDRRSNGAFEFRHQEICVFVHYTHGNLLKLDLHDAVPAKDHHAENLAKGQKVSVAASPDNNSSEVKVYNPLLGEDNDEAVASSTKPSDHTKTELGKAEEEQLDRSVWQTLLQAIPACCLIVSPQGKVVFASRTQDKVFHTPPGEPWPSSGTFPNSCVALHPDGTHFASEEYPIQRTVDTGEIMRGVVLTVVRHDKTVGTLRITSSPVYNNAEFIAVVAVIEDVTDAMKLQNEYDSLQNRFSAAVESNKLKSEFVSSVSHELRTPINGLLGLENLVADESTDSGSRQTYLRQIHDLHTHLKRIVDTLLDFQDLSSAKHDAEVEANSLIDAVTEVMESLAKTSAEAHVVVSFLPCQSDFPPLLMFDSRLIKNVLYQLICNGIRYTLPHGEVKIRLSLEDDGQPIGDKGKDLTADEIRGDRQSDIKKFMVIEVEDNGIGIENVPELFAPFSKGPIAHISRPSGLGLGLSIAQSVADIIGGSIKAQSTPGKGSIFRFAFPYRPCPQANKRSSRPIPTEIVTTESMKGYIRANSAPSTPPVETATRHQFAPLPDMSKVDKPSVLIVEDDLINSSILERTFTKAGCQVVAAVNGKLAVSECTKAQYSFDLVIMDVMLPELDGIRATAEIRKLEADGGFKAMNIVGFTASTSTRVLEDCISVGMNQVIQKPCAGKKFLGMVEKYLGRS